jgi:hypothetical protein
MPRIFSFEREIHATLELVPLTVRRKLDLAGLKISLGGWQALPVADRRALAEAEVEDEASVSGFAAALRAAAARSGVDLRPIAVPCPPPWRTPAVPDAVKVRAAAAGAPLDDGAWARLDDDARHALLHLAGRGSEEHEARFRAALVELGLGRV